MKYTVITVLCLLSTAGSMIEAESAPVSAPPTLPESYKQSLHPALTTTPDEIMTAAKHGQDWAKKGRKADDLMKSTKRTPKWIRGRKGTAKHSVVYCQNLDSSLVSYIAYKKTTLYEPLDLPTVLTKEKNYRLKLNFLVNLISAPVMGVDRDADIAADIASAINPRGAAEYRSQVPVVLRRQANKAEVSVIKFIVSDDRGNNWEVDGSELKDEKAGEMEFAGTDKVLDQRSTTNSNAQANASLITPDGQYYSGSSTAWGRSTTTSYKYVDWSEKHPYYEALYTVSFSLINPDGTARITSTTKKITLRIITQAGEQIVEYALKNKK